MECKTLFFMTMMIGALLTVSFIDVEGKSSENKEGSKTQRLYCWGETNPIMSAEIVETTIMIELEQRLGTCIYKNERSKLYELPYYPVMYDVQIIDYDFDAVIDEQRIVGTLNEIINVNFEEIEPEVPWCINVISYWMDAEEKTNVLELEMCI